MSRSSNRLKIPEATKSIVIIRSIQDLALFEESTTSNLVDSKNQSNKKIKEIEEKNNEIHKALKEKEVILVPKTNQAQSEISKQKETVKSQGGAIAQGVIIKEAHFRESSFQKDITRTSYYLKYNNNYSTFRTNNDIYEASQEDMHFLSQLQGSLFNINNFEYLIISFEEETKFDEIKKEFIFYMDKARTLFQGNEMIEDSNFESNILKIFEVTLFSIGKRKEHKEKNHFFENIFGGNQLWQIYLKIMIYLSHTEEKNEI